MTAVIAMIYNFESLSFQVLSVLSINHKEGFYRVKGRPYAALGFRLEGKGEFKIGGSELNSQPGDVIFIPAGQDYDVKYTGGKSIVIHMTDCNYTESETIYLSNSSFLQTKFEELLETQMSAENINGTKSLIYSILQFMSDDSALARKAADLNYAVSLINENIANANIGISDICRKTGMSEATMRRRFLQRYGIPPKQYLLKMRLNKAVSLLLKGEASVKETASLCGFSDEKYFSRAIKKQYGVAPSEFRKTK